MTTLVTQPVFSTSTAAGQQLILQHPTHPAVICVSFLDANTRTAELLEKFAADFAQQTVASALDVHQVAERYAQEVSDPAQLSLIVGSFVDERCMFAALRGSVFLKRAGKVGRILHAADQIGVIEGRWKSTDEFVLMTHTTEQAEQVVTGVMQKLGAELKEDLPEVLGSVSNSLGIARLEFTDKVPAAVVSESEGLRDSTPQTPIVSQSPSTPKGPSLFASIGQVGRSLGGTVVRQIFSFSRTLDRWRTSLFSQDVYVRQRTTKKTIRIILPLFFLIVLGSAGVFIFRSQRADQVRAAEAIIQPLDTRLNEIKSTVNQDPITARKQTEEIIIQLEQAAEQHKDKKITANELNRKLREIRQFYDSISGMEEFAVLPTFFDLRLVESDFIANRIAISGDNLLFLDQERKKVIALNTTNKQSTALPIGDITRTTDLIATARNLYLLGSGIYQFGLSGSQPANQVRTEEDPLTGAEFIRTYNQNLYVLNESKRNIFRYTIGEGTSLGESTGWVRADQSIPFESIQSFAIDSDVWLTTKTGEIIRMRTGRQEEFAVNGLKENFSTPITIYASDTTENLYVLEPSQNRLVILTKDGEFLREVKSSTLASTNGLVVNEAAKKAFVISGALVFEVGL